MQPPDPMQATPPPYPVNARGQRVCGAKTRNSRTGLPTCQTTQLGPSGRCRMHGGFKRITSMARYERVLPDALRAAYVGALNDPGVLSLKDDVALSTARIEATLEGLALGPALDDLAASWEAFQSAAATRDPVRVQQAAQAHGATILAAQETREKFREVERLQAHKARLASAEFRRQLAASSMIEASAAWALVTTMLELVKAHVPDTGARRAIADGLIRLTGAATLRGPD